MNIYENIPHFKDFTVPIKGKIITRTTLDKLFLDRKSNENATTQDQRFVIIARIHG